MTRVGAVVLAAGESSRYGSPKQNVLLPEVLARLANTDVSEVVVVSGAHPLEVPDTLVIHCPDWEAGPGASLRCGLQALSPTTEAAMVILADGPDLAPAAVERVIDDWQKNGGPIVAASYGGSRGHPLLVARSAWDDIPDDGLRGRTARLVPCDDLGYPGDVDTPDDLPTRLR